MKYPIITWDRLLYPSWDSYRFMPCRKKFRRRLCDKAGYNYLYCR